MHDIQHVNPDVSPWCPKTSNIDAALNKTIIFVFGRSVGLESGCRTLAPQKFELLDEPHEINIFLFELSSEMRQPAESQSIDIDAALDEILDATSDNL